MVEFSMVEILIVEFFMEFFGSMKDLLGLTKKKHVKVRGRNQVTN